MANKYMSTKKHFILFISIILSFIFAVTVFVIVIDPYFHFHGPIQGVGYQLNNERYQDDGIVRHFKYNAMITGSSMTENFMTTELDSLFQVNSIKVPLEGGLFKEINELCLTAIDNNPNLNMIIRSIDGSFIFNEKDEYAFDEDDYPYYLYDGIGLNDFNYILNKSVVIAAGKDLINTLRNIPMTTFDDYYRWEEKLSRGITLLTIDNPESYSHLSLEEKENIIGSIKQNFIELIEENPNIQFYLFIPPYSINSWIALNNDGTILREIEAEEVVIALLIKYDNVHLFSFNDDDIIYDLNMYCDDWHYCSDVNTYILKCMKTGEHQLTESNYYNYFYEFRDKMSRYFSATF